MMSFVRARHRPPTRARLSKPADEAGFALVRRLVDVPVIALPRPIVVIHVVVALVVHLVEVDALDELDDAGGDGVGLS